MNERAGVPVVYYAVQNRLPNGKWPACRITIEVLSEHDTVHEAARSCVEAKAGPGTIGPNKVDTQ